MDPTLGLGVALWAKKWRLRPMEALDTFDLDVILKRVQAASQVAANNEKVGSPPAVLADPEFVTKFRLYLLATVEEKDFFDYDRDTLDEMDSICLQYTLKDFLVACCWHEDERGCDKRRRLLFIDHAKEVLMTYVINQYRRLDHRWTANVFGCVDDLIVELTNDEDPKSSASSDNHREGKVKRLKHTKILEEELDPPLRIGLCSAGDRFDSCELREFFETLIKLTVLDAVSQVESINREIRALKYLEAHPEPDQIPSPSAPMPLAWAKLNDASQLREFYKDRVMKPGHELPSMSLADCLAKEYHQEVEILGGGEGIRRKPQPKAEEPDATTSEDDNVAARAWDDWGDLHPKGAGNKMVNRG